MADWASMIERQNPQLFARPRRLGWLMPDGNANVTLSGVVIIEDEQHASFRGIPGGWHRDSVLVLPRTDLAAQFQLPTPAQGQEWQARVLQHVVYGALTSIAHDGQANDVGWALDEFRLDNDQRSVINDIVLRYELAVRELNGWIYRIGYWVNFIAQFYQAPIPPPPR